MLPSKKPYNIYLHIKPCGEVFYVGIGSTKRRPYEIIGRNKLWKHVANKYPNYEIQIIKRGLTKDQACELESILISWFGRRDTDKGTLTNLTDGGESTYGRIMEDWQKKIMSDYCKENYVGKANPNYGNNWSEEDKLRMSKIKKKQYETGEISVNYEACKKGIQNRNRNWEENPELKELMAKRVSKKVSKYAYLQIDIITGEIVNEFESFMSLKESYYKVGKTVIHSVCNGHKVSYLGYLWRYRDKETGEVIVPELKSNKGFDKYYEVEGRRYLKITHAADAEKVNYSTIANRFDSNNYPEYKVKKINHCYH